MPFSQTLEMVEEALSVGGAGVAAWEGKYSQQPIQSLGLMPSEQ